MSSAIQILLCSVLCWYARPLQCFQFFIDLFDIFVISYCWIHVDCWLLISLLVLSILIAHHQAISTLFFLVCWLLPCLLSHQFFYFLPDVCITLLLVSLTAVFILDISSVIPATCCNIIVDWYKHPLFRRFRKNPLITQQNIYFCWLRLLT